MNRLYVLAGALAVAVIVAGVRAEEDKKDKAEKPTIKKIMKDAHGGSGLRALIIKSLKEDDFATAGKAAKTWVELADTLAKSKPPKGEAASWKKLTDSYTKTVKSL